VFCWRWAQSPLDCTVTAPTEPSHVVWFIVHLLVRVAQYGVDEAVRSLVHAFATSRLDYCNSLYAYSSVSTRQRLQHVQNCAACLVADAPCLASSRPLLHQLHWLPVEAWITYKLYTNVSYFQWFSTAISGRTLSTLFWRSTAILVASGLRCTTDMQTFGWQFIFCCGTYCMDSLRGRISSHIHLQLIL